MKTVKDGLLTFILKAATNTEVGSSPRFSPLWVQRAKVRLSQQYKTIGIIAVIVAVIIAVIGLLSENFEDYLNYKVAIAFVIGAAFSILSGFIGMKVSVNSNIRTASAARGSLDAAFKTSFRGGAISGIAVSLLSLAGLFLVFYIYYIWCDENMTTTLHSVVGYAFGASMAALFAQLGGGIYTKAADLQQCYSTLHE